MDRNLVDEQEQETMTPRATYRVQFNKEFGFKQAAEIVPYLKRLGISHIYASPWLKARPGSSHGYDIVDHHALNPELGDRADFDAMVAALQENGIGQILDFVPNHMGVGGADNPLWLDMLEWGQVSAYAGWFDIDWHPDPAYLHDKILIPFLGGQYGVELYSGRLCLRFDQVDGSFAVWAYGSHKLPISPLLYEVILGDDHPELERLGDAFKSLPDWRPQVVRRARELKDEMARLAREREDVLAAILHRLAHFEGIAGVDESWKHLDKLIRQQHWRVAHFRVASDDINYRRFFDVNDLAGLRMELPEVFDYTHSLIFQMVKDGTLDGLRIDHVDGLLNPKEYLQRLRTLGEPNEPQKPFYLVVEKILAYHENLHEDWPVDGTTGYEFTNLVLGLLIDPAGEVGFTKHYAEFTEDRRQFAEVVREGKLRIMRNEMSSELNVLASEVARVAHQQPKTTDFTHNVLRRAIREVVASFPVYRTYVDAEGKPGDEDRRDLNWAMKRARANDNGVDPSVFDFVCRVLSGDLVAEGGAGFSRSAVLRCAMKLQQYSGPVMAKGLEDTAFYRYNRFIALNEVGGYPEHFGMTLTNFHKANSQRAKRWPDSMLSTSTHDTKRGEDTRARLAVLSEMPDQWSKQTRLWSHVLRARRGDIQAAAPPDHNDEYLFYQLLVGTWPVALTAVESLDREVLKNYLERMKGAMTKSMREAKVHSTWATPNSSYEDAVLAFVEGALDLESSSAFYASFLPFQARIAQLSVANSLVQTTLKLTCPGVPDIYQGADLWDLSMVDPDNRRPVDFPTRTQMLEDLETDQRSFSDLKTQWRDGAVKLFVIHKLLQLRVEKSLLFGRGEYEPLLAEGPKADCICAFVRRLEGHCMLVFTARFPLRLENDPDWNCTVVSVPESLASKKFRNIFTGAEVSFSGRAVDPAIVFDGNPVAVLTLLDQN